VRGLHVLSERLKPFRLQQNDHGRVALHPAAPPPPSPAGRGLCALTLSQRERVGPKGRGEGFALLRRGREPFRCGKAIGRVALHPAASPPPSPSGRGLCALTLFQRERVGPKGRGEGFARFSERLKPFRRSQRHGRVALHPAAPPPPSPSGRGLCARGGHRFTSQVVIGAPSASLPSFNCTPIAASSSRMRSDSAKFFALRASRRAAMRGVISASEGPSATT
jgi:hypothetical protein